LAEVEQKQREEQVGEPGAAAVSKQATDGEAAKYLRAGKPADSAKYLPQVAQVAKYLPQVAVEGFRVRVQVAHEGEEHAEAGAPVASEEQSRWQTSTGDREKIWRVMTELAWTWEEKERKVREDACPELADDAEAFKNGLMLLRPASRRSWNVVLADNPAFWNRVSLHHLRMLGARHWYAVVHSLDGAHRLLVLKVPPVKFASEEARADHAWRQWTYRDDEFGRFQLGLRVSDDFMSLLDEQDYESHGRPYRTGGHHMDLVEVPKTCRMDNYRSYEEHGELALVDWNRQLEMGWMEGPLHAVPRVVNAQAGIVKGVKFRPVVDARRSLLNEAIRCSECK
jgi:hypothetical protein